MNQLIDLTGQKFGRLLVLNRVENDRFGEGRYRCLCECERETLVRSQSLKRGNTKSCGCYAKEVSRKNGKANRRNGSIDKKGYRVVYVNGERVMEHRVVMEQKMGCKLMSNENVHHKNGNRLDNRLENLELWVKTQPSGQRVEDRVKDAIEILERYAPEELREKRPRESLL